jgi:hypothetical protein
MKLSSLIIILLSCSNKNNCVNIHQENIVEDNYFYIFSQKNINKVEMLHPLEYYKNESPRPKGRGILRLLSQNQSNNSSCFL